MKTLLKPTFTSYLIIGLLTSFFTLNTSCNKIREYAQFGTFNFINQTNLSITFYNKLSSIKYAEYTTLPKSTTSIEKTQDAVKNVNATTYRSPLLGFTPPLIVKFDNVKCLEITPESEHTPLDLKNYSVEKLGKRSYKFSYTFTEADYNRAIICP